MARRYEWLLALRYLRSAHRRGFVSFVAAVAMLGLMLGVAVLLIVLSVLNGFEYELRGRILNVTAHATLSGLDGTLPRWREQLLYLRGRAGVAAAAPYIEQQVMLAHDTRVLAVTLRGVRAADERALGGLARLTLGA
ncbi:MAG: ABC transporter permease, partial [Gammaproteobacteria bacterium]|nr:ABC transporter permease [Gammaproteobacteria bacterium]